jgi:imidazolonepropionase-like amidohydrolase
MGNYVFLVLLVLPAPLFARPEQEAQQKRLAITSVSVIDCTGQDAQPDMTLVLTGDRITALGKAQEVAVPDGAQVIDGAGKFLIPGLWDMHAHCFHRPYLPLFTANGVVGIRIMWGTTEHRKWRKEVADGSLLGPRLVLAGAPVDGPNPVWPGSIAVATEEDGRKAVQTTKNDGYDFVKVYSLLPEDAYAAIAAEARKQGLPFGGHVPEAVSAARASDLGQKSIEHLWGVAFACSSKEGEQRKVYLADLAQSGPSMLIPVHNRHTAMCLDSYDEKKAAALFARFVRNGTWQVPTLTVLRPKAYRGDQRFTEDPRLKYVLPSDRAYWARFLALPADQFTEPLRVYRKELAIVGSMHEAGVKLLAGTDTPGPYCFPGFGLHDELALLVEAGLSPMAALQTATRNPAQFLGREKDFGTVEQGKLADLVLLDANPLKDIKNTKRIASVIAGGKLVTREALDRMLAEVEAQASKK